MRKVTQRIKIVDNLEDCIGMETYTNLSPTMKAKLLRYDTKKTYFISTKSEYSRLDKWAGQEFYLPTQMAVTMKFE